MAEFIIVPFPDDRELFVDGAPNGRTNRKVSVERGSHTFDLGEPVNYTPESQFTSVAGTSFAQPMVITFNPATVAAGVEAAVAGVEAAPAPPRAARASRKKASKKKASKKKASKAKTASKKRRRRKGR